MSETLMPVVVHRWFSRGEGWAFHPNLQPRLVRIIKAVEPHLKLRATERFNYHFDDGSLVGDVSADASCSNQLAVDRNPSILRVAYIHRKLSSCETEDVYDHLKELVLPDSEGPDEELRIELFEEPSVPPAETETRFDHAFKKLLEGILWRPAWGMAAALLFLLIACLLVASFF